MIMATDPFANLTPAELKGLREAARYFGAEGYKGKLKSATSTKRIVDYKKAEAKKLIAASKMAESVKKRTGTQTSTSAKPSIATVRANAAKFGPQLPKSTNKSSTSKTAKMNPKKRLKDY